MNYLPRYGRLLGRTTFMFHEIFKCQKINLTWLCVAVCLLTRISSQTVTRRPPPHDVDGGGQMVMETNFETMNQLISESASSQTGRAWDLSWCGSPALDTFSFSIFSSPPPLLPVTGGFLLIRISSHASPSLLGSAAHPRRSLCRLEWRENC